MRDPPQSGGQRRDGRRHDRQHARHLREAPEDLRGWEWQHLHAQLDDSRATVRGLSDKQFAADFDPTLTRVVGFRADETAGKRAAPPHAWDALTGKPLGAAGSEFPAGFDPLQVTPVAGGPLAEVTAAG